MAVFHFLSHLSFQFEKVCFLFLLVHCTKISSGKMKDCSLTLYFCPEDGHIVGSAKFPSRL